MLFPRYECEMMPKCQMFCMFNSLTGAFKRNYAREKAFTFPSRAETNLISNAGTQQNVPPPPNQNSESRPHLHFGGPVGVEIRGGNSTPAVSVQSHLDQILRVLSKSRAEGE